MDKRVARQRPNAYLDPGRAQRAENTRRAREAFLRRDLAPDAYPVALEASLQAGCNADCLFCGTGDKWRAHPDRPSSDWLAQRVLGELAPHVERLNWTCDNEPLLSRPFMEWLGTSPSLPVVHIQTNGFLLPARLDVLSSARTHLGLGVSLNAASARTHAMLMGCSVSQFERVVAAMREFVRRGAAPGSPGRRTLSVMFVVQRANLRELADMVALAQEVGARSVALRNLFAACNTFRERDGYFYEKRAEVVPRDDPELEAQLARAARILAERPERECRLDVAFSEEPEDDHRAYDVQWDPTRNYSSARDEDLLRQHFRRLQAGGLSAAQREALEREARELIPRVCRPQPPVDPRRASPHLAQPTERRSDRVCDMPWRTCDIDAAGDLRPCNRTFYSFGNLRQATVREVWTGDQARRLRELMVSGVVPSCCAGCQHYGPDVHGC